MLKEEFYILLSVLKSHSASIQTWQLLKKVKQASLSGENFYLKKNLHKDRTTCTTQILYALH